MLPTRQYLVDIYKDSRIIATTIIFAKDAYDAETQVMDEYEADDAIAWYIEPKNN